MLSALITASAETNFNFNNYCMKSNIITAKSLRAMGFPESPVIPVVLEAVKKHLKHTASADIEAQLKALLQAPENFYNDSVFATAAQKLKPPVEDTTTGCDISLNNTGIPFAIYGAHGIEAGAMHQMYTAAKLPVAVAGALMPDAHQGYGLPIGGVLATNNAVIPYGVGVDIGCRMCLSIFDIVPTELVQRENFFTRELLEATLFGSGAQFKQPANHAVMDSDVFDALPLLKSLKDRAWRQLGSSGSGNHFAEFGAVHIVDADTLPSVPAGTYIGLLTHSGSRALGANIAAHYTKLAKQLRRLPGEAANLAWLTLDEEAGAEYWMAMNLAGDYASACHHIIHAKVARQLGRKPLTMVENHHNFAWKETWNGQEVIVHRKGATPAAAGVLGIIPGSMTAPGYIVKGRGEMASVNSASHGAGRLMSRSKAMQNITHEAMKAELKKHGVKLLGGGLDEAPFAYKDIHAVMQEQTSLVDIIGSFQPKIVQMCGDAQRGWRRGPREKWHNDFVEGE